MLKLKTITLRHEADKKKYDAKFKAKVDIEALNIPIGQWHTVRALESETVILEMKDGPYEPTGPEDILK